MVYVVETLDHRFPGSELSGIAPEELCAARDQEVLGLHAVRQLAAARRWDPDVVDCASTDALRMLTLPPPSGCTSRNVPGRGITVEIIGTSTTASLARTAGRIRASVRRLSTLLTDGALVSAHRCFGRVVAAERSDAGVVGARGRVGCSSNRFWCKTRTMVSQSARPSGFHWYARTSRGE